MSGPRSSLSSHHSSPARSRDFPADRPDPLRELLALPGVGDSVGATRRAVDAVIGHRILRQRSAEVSAESALRGAWASAVLEGSGATLEEVRAGLAEARAAEEARPGADPAGDVGGPIMGPPLPSAGGALADPLVQGALRVSAGLGALAETWPRAPRQALARLHVLAAADLVDSRDRADALGRLRSAGEGAASGAAGDPAAPGQIAARLDALAGLVVPGGTGAPAGVLAAIVQGELLALRPFGTADGIVARAAARLTFVDRGLDPKSLIALEVGQLRVRDEIADALDGYRSGSAAGVGQWLVLCGRAYALGAQETLAICEALERG
ncbi:MAG: hypothetical protein LBQ06_03500 [Frankiaceae bacterium]|nr:hypothetical protein [Frankiaceae bacterium]